jgi:urease accessory protein
MRRLSALVAGATLAAPAPASAHLVGVEFGDFYAGALHVATGVEHMAALVALALVAALTGRAAGRWALVATPPAILAGALWTAALGGAPWMESGVLAALALLGALAALAARLPQTAMAALSAAAGLAVGAANGLAAAEADVDVALYAAGAATTGLIAVTLGAAAATVALSHAPLVAIGYRVAGSWIGAVGLATFSLAVLRG